jgi:uncharacterized coiled-coil DUF342 family protein
MLQALGLVVVFVAAAGALWLAWSALQQVKQLRAELDETQRQVNETQLQANESQRQANEAERQANEAQRQVNELKAAAAAEPPLPPLPRGRSSGLEDLREQLRAAHREEDSDT